MYTDADPHVHIWSIYNVFGIWIPLRAHVMNVRNRQTQHDKVHRQPNHQTSDL